MIIALLTMVIVCLLGLLVAVASMGSRIVNGVDAEFFACKRNMPCVFNETSHAGKVLSALHWAASLPAAEDKTFSQNKEDGVIQAIFERYTPVDKYYVEFGTESCKECNTRLLRQQNWTGLLMDGSHNNTAINLHKEHITVGNIVSLFCKHQVPTTFDLLSVDTDCFDFWLTKKILEAGYQPRVIINEVNTANYLIDPVAILEPDSTEYPSDWYCEMNTYYGASVAAFAWLYNRHNYSMIYCESMGVNCFGVHNSVLGADLSEFLTASALYQPPQYQPYRTCGTHPQSWEGFPYVNVVTGAKIHLPPWR
eukprot:g43002.t1